MREVIRDFIPPILLKILRGRRAGLPAPDLWSGSYSSWQEATAHSSGYNESNILDACKTSLLKVKNGEAVYERDSVLFDKIQYSWPVLACLENIALENHGELSVIDFGGSLGSTYFQNRHFLKHVRSLKWIVVEQEQFVTTGKKEFEDDCLKFEFTIEDAFKGGKIHCLLLSGVLQYLPDPFEWIVKFKRHYFDYILIDRTAFSESQSDMLTIQNVPDSIYKASYPCWFFNEGRFLNYFEPEYQLIADFDGSFDPPVITNNVLAFWKGHFFARKKEV